MKETSDTVKTIFALTNELIAEIICSKQSFLPKEATNTLLDVERHDSDSKDSSVPSDRLDSEAFFGRLRFFLVRSRLSAKEDIH